MEGRYTGQGKEGGNFLCPSWGCFSHGSHPSVSSVHPASTFPAIQGASLPALTTQPSPLVSGGFPPPEEETHSQPVNPHSLHHLHAAYRVGERWSLSVPTCQGLFSDNPFLYLLICLLWGQVPVWGRGRRCNPIMCPLFPPRNASTGDAGSPGTQRPP